MRTSLNSTVVELNEQLIERKYDIDKGLLRYCQRFERLKSGDLVSFKLYYDQIAFKYKECLTIHNALVDTINTINNNNN